MTKNAMLAALLLAVIAHPAIAQPGKAQSAKGPVISESALIGALTPPTEEERAKQRNIRRDTSGNPIPMAKPKAPQADLLIEFETNSTELTPEAKQQLDIVGRALKTDQLAKFTFKLEGHADPRGSSEWNQTLSDGRADAVRQYLIQNQKVNPDRLTAEGKGDRFPVNADYPADPRNRRVTILTVTAN